MTETKKINVTEITKELEKSSAVASFTKKGSAIIEHANQFTIRKADDIGKVIDFIAAQDIELAIIDKELEEIIEPTREGLEGAYALKRKLRAPYEEARKICDIKVKAFKIKERDRSEAERIKNLKEAEEKERKERERLSSEADKERGAGNVDTAELLEMEAKTFVVEPKLKKIESSNIGKTKKAVSHFKPEFKVLNILLFAKWVLQGLDKGVKRSQFLEVNKKALTNHIGDSKLKSGDIPGISISYIPIIQYRKK